MLEAHTSVGPGKIVRGFVAIVLELCPKQHARDHNASADGMNSVTFAY